MVDSKVIDHLHKVALRLHVHQDSGSEENGAPFEFIYGVGSGGITPFEKALYHKKAGDRIVMEIRPGALCETFGHLEVPLSLTTAAKSALHLEITVTGVVRAQDREVIKAMASGGSCSDCGCGCGGH